MDTATILLVWATALVVLLIRTHSFRTSISTTLMTCTMLVLAAINKLNNHPNDGITLCVMMMVVSILVIRVIPYNTIDKWVKGTN